MSRVLVVVAHADELAFHAGGTIARLAAEGHEIYQVVVTTGSKASFTMEKGALEVIIRQEAHRSAELLGLQDVFLWDYGDGLLHEGRWIPSLVSIPGRPGISTPISSSSARPPTGPPIFPGSRCTIRIIATWAWSRAPSSIGTILPTIPKGIAWRPSTSARRSRRR